jgi:hypothetical protein
MVKAEAEVKVEVKVKVYQPRAGLWAKHIEYEIILHAFLGSDFLTINIKE